MSAACKHCHKFVFVFRQSSVILEFSEGWLDSVGSAGRRWSELHQLKLVLRRMSEDQTQWRLSGWVCLRSADHYKATSRNIGKSVVVVWYSVVFLWHLLLSCVFIYCCVVAVEKLHFTALHFISNKCFAAITGKSDHPTVVKQFITELYVQRIRGCFFGVDALYKLTFYLLTYLPF